MASYIDSAAIVSSGTALVIYQNSIGLTAGEVGILSFLLTIFIAVGALIGGRLGDRYGRKPVFMSTMLLIVIGALMLVLAPSFALLAVGMAMVGLGSGADLPVSLATIAEAATNSNRGKLVSFTQVLWTAGIMASLGFGAIVGDMGRLGGQIMFAHVGVVALIVMVARFGIPESVEWTDARDIQKTSASAGRHIARLRDLLKKPYLVPFLALLVFYPLTNLAANTNGQFGAYMFVNVAGTSVTFFSTLSLGVTFLGIMFVLLFMRVVDGQHRIAWYRAGAVCGILGFTVPAVFGVTLPTLLIQVLLMQFFGAFAFEPIMKVWTQESFPTLLRTTAQGTIIAVGRVLAAGLALVTPLILEWGPQTLFAFLAVVITIGTGAAYIVFRKHRRNQFTEETRSTAPAKS